VTHRITFDDCEPSPPNIVVEAEEGVGCSTSNALPSDPQSDGHIFAGWRLYDVATREYGAAFDPDAPVTGDLYVAASWTPKTFGGAEAPQVDTASDGKLAASHKTPALPQTSDAFGVTMVVASAMSAMGTAALAFGGKLRKKD
ncbi:MAG: hypothetical protein SOU51_07165, partial [Collinsella sp.]|nr:hypothetical protein [Collinsella sp.]